MLTWTMGDYRSSALKSSHTKNIGASSYRGALLSCKDVTIINSKDFFLFIRWTIFTLSDKQNLYVSHFVWEYLYALFLLFCISLECLSLSIVCCLNLLPFPLPFVIPMEQTLYVHERFVYNKRTVFLICYATLWIRVFRRQRRTPGSNHH